MRISSALSVAALPLALLSPIALRAADSTPIDPTTMQVLLVKAQHAGLRDQCYLYARLVHDGTEVAAQDIASGDRAEAAHMLVAVEGYAASLNLAMVENTKRLKEAEILLRESAFHLRSAMLASALEDRPAMASALKSIDAAESKTMVAVFAH
jgi:hypothetical protein